MLSSISYCFVLTFALSIIRTNADIIVLPIDGHIIENEMVDLPANFGAQLPLEGLRAMVKYAEPADACSAIKTPPDWENRTKRWVLLVRRGNCSFEQKVRTAQAALYDGVIVHNFNEEGLVPMNANNSTGIYIPSVFVTEIKGIELRDLYANENYFVIINSEVPFNIQTHLILPFAIVVGICFIVMVVFMIIKCIKDRRRQRRHRLPTSALNKLTSCKYQKGDPYETCVICLDDYVEGEKLRVLPCNHAYHMKCIDPWLTKNKRVCPICKRKVFTQDETPFADSDSEAETDDTSPLVNRSGRQTDGGTFQVQTENPFQRAARSISQELDSHFVTASGYHSINTELDDSSEYSSMSNDGSRECLVSGPRQEQGEVRVHTRPGTSGRHENV